MAELLDLDRDLWLTREDFIAMGRPPQEQGPDLESYLDFLAEVEAFEAPPPLKKFYPDEFDL